MKTSSPSAPGRHHAGFTLIELLVVVAIIATLAALTAAGVTAAQKRSKVSDTQTRIKVIEDSLTQYQNNNGEFPIPANEGMMGEFPGSSNQWRMGAAACLYQALTGDGNDQIRGYKVRGNEKPGASIGEFGSTYGEIYLKDANIQRSQWFILSSGIWAIVDAFRQPFQYLPKTPLVDPKLMRNEATYDLWSYGTLKTPSADADNVAAQQWITNWK